MTETAGEVGDLHLATVVVNVTAMERGVRFWTNALGYEQRKQSWDPEFMMLVDPRGKRTPISLQLTGVESHQAARVHLDLYTSEQSRHVDRLVSLGASIAQDWPYPPDPDFIVLRDPDGNEFCVIDHAPIG